MGRTKRSEYIQEIQEGEARKRYSTAAVERA